MSFINHFISALGKDEKKHLNEFIGTTLFKNHQTKEFQLYNLLQATDPHGLNDEFLAYKIYGDTDAVSLKNLRSLRSHLFNKILDCINHESFINNDEIDDLEKTSIQLRKKLISARILLRKGDADFKDVTEHLLNEIIEEAKKIQSYPVLIEALTIKKYRLNIRNGIEKFESVQKEINHYFNCYIATNKANDYYHKLIINKSFISTNTDEEYSQQLQLAISDLEKEYASTGAIDILYFLYYLKLEYAHHTGTYEDAIDVCLEMLNSMRNFPSLYRKERIGYIYDNLAQCQIYLEEYDNALQTIQEAQKHYKPHSFAALISREVEFYANFYNKTYERARELCQLMLQHPKSDTGEFRHDRIIYYAACVDFALGKYNEALKKCTQSLEIRKDKAGWEIALRTLTIMCQIELGHIDAAIAGIEALRKHLSRNTGKYPIKQRDELIYKALCEFEKTGFECFELTPKNEKILIELSANNTSASWQKYSPELIPFHQWLEKRICATAVIKHKLQVKKNIR